MTAEYLRRLDALTAQVQSSLPAQAQRVVQAQVAQQHAVFAALAQKTMPAHLQPVGLSVALLSAAPQLLAVDEHLSLWRQAVATQFGVWHVYSQAWLTDLRRYLAKHPGRILELMAGNATLSAELPGATAVDNFKWSGQLNERPKPWTAVVTSDAQAYVAQHCHEFSTIIWAWAPDTSELDWQIYQTLVAQKWHGQLIVIGEKNGATGSKAFWQHAPLHLNYQLNRNHASLDRVHDRVWVTEMN